MIVVALLRIWSELIMGVCYLSCSNARLLVLEDFDKEQ